jgi:2-methylisocitrate lyase-like PEP mutase family enzyme
MNNLSKAFYSLHQQSTPLLLPNAWDAASARIFEDLGAAAIATTSAGVAWSLGYADGGNLSPQAQAQVAQNITRVIKVPLSVDFENGYSDSPHQVAENIKPLLDAGVAGINIEDGTDTPELLAEKIEAIRKAADSYGSELFINARTDVYLASLVPAEQRVDEVIARSKLFEAAGASGFFVPFVLNEHEIKKIVQFVALPVNVLSVPNLPGIEKLAQLGVKRLSAGSSIAQVVWQHAGLLAEKFLNDGNTVKAVSERATYAKLQELFG